MDQATTYILANEALHYLTDEEHLFLSVTKEV